MRKEKIKTNRENNRKGFNRLKKVLVSTVLTIATLTSLTACGGSKSTETKSSDESKVIRVGVCAGPYGDMFEEAIKPSLEEKGYKVEITEFSDYVQPNTALADNEIDVNLFQHSTYLKNFSSQHNLDLTYISEVPTAGMAVFSNKAKSIDDIPDGSSVAIPNDDTNLSRALRVLAQTGVITLKSDIDPAKATVNDIAENPKNLTFTEVSAEVMTSVLDSTGAAVINGNYAISGGLNLSDALYNEKIAEGYFNVIAVRTSDENAQFVQDIKEIVKSDAFKKVIEDESKQYSSFSKPSGY